MLALSLGDDAAGALLAVLAVVAILAVLFFLFLRSPRKAVIAGFGLAVVAGGVFLLNSLFGPDKVWDELPVEVQQAIIDKKLNFYVINGYDVAEKTGMGGRMNTIMQTAFFAISGVLPRDQAIAKLEAKLAQKNEVLAELMQEHVQLKKELGEL